MVQINDSNSGKYTNPTSVPRKVEIIRSTDPRNNILFLAQNPDVIVLDDDTSSEVDAPTEYQDLEDFSSEGHDPQQLFLSTLAQDVPQTLSQANILFPVISAPSNLYLDPKSFRLENAGSVSSDGRVTMVATLTFDEVPGAVSYEYQIDAGE